MLASDISGSVWSPLVIVSCDKNLFGACKEPSSKICVVSGSALKRPQAARERRAHRRRDAIFIDISRGRERDDPPEAVIAFKHPQLFVPDLAAELGHLLGVAHALEHRKIKIAGAITTPTATGPAKAPAPASSIPAKKFSFTLSLYKRKGGTGFPGAALQSALVHATRP